MKPSTKKMGNLLGCVHCVGDELDTLFVNDGKEWIYKHEGATASSEEMKKELESGFYKLIIENTSRVFSFMAEVICYYNHNNTISLQTTKKLPSQQKVEIEFKAPQDRSMLRVLLKTNLATPHALNNIYFSIVLTKLGELNDPLLADNKTIYLPPPPPRQSPSKVATTTPTPDAAITTPGRGAEVGGGGERGDASVSVVVFSDEDIPEEFFDPITLEIMEDPVIIGDGNTYDRSSITEWFSRSNTSPLTNQVIPNREAIVPNLLVRHQIETFKQKHPELFRRGRNNDANNNNNNNNALSYK